MEDGILQPAVVPYLRNLTIGTWPNGPRWQRSSPRVIADYLQDEGVERTLWPASSPDLNPVEPLVGSAYAVHDGVTETTALADLHEKSRGWGMGCHPTASRLLSSMKRRSRAVCFFGPKMRLLTASTNKAGNQCLSLSHWSPWRFGTMESTPTVDK